MLNVVVKIGESSITVKNEILYTDYITFTLNDLWCMFE